MATSAATGGRGGMGGAITVLESSDPRPAPAGPNEPVGVAPDAGEPAIGDGPVGGELAEDSPGSLGADGAVAACTVSETNCVRLYIAVADAETGICLQLSLDDCNDTTRPGLTVDVPLSWRVASAFVGALGAECVPNTAFDVMNDTAIVAGSGLIAWNRDSRRPSQISIDVVLQPSVVAVDNTPIRVTNGDLVEEVAECSS